MERPAHRRPGCRRARTQTHPPRRAHAGGQRPHPPHYRDGQVSERPFDYPGNLLPFFRIAFAPDGTLYGSTVLPIHLVRYDESRRALADAGDLGGGEIYSLLARGDRLLMAAYAGLAPLMSFDPSRPVSLRGDAPNPVLVNYPGSDSGWRPQAFIDGPDGKVYAGAIAGYGRLGGPLTIWDTATNTVEQFHHVVRDQSVNSLAVWKKAWRCGRT